MARLYVFQIKFALHLCIAVPYSRQTACLTNGLYLEIKSIHEILGARFGPQQPALVSEPGRMNDIILTFPSFPVASLLLESYKTNVDNFCRVLHIPTVESLVKAFYLRINQEESAFPCQAALLLSIFSIAAFFHQPFQGSEIATTRHDAIYLSKFWGKIAWDVLDHSRRNTLGTLEDVQAHILLSFSSIHIEGFSARARLLSSSAGFIARELGLHRLDVEAESFSEHKPRARDLVVREVKRRVFWDIASTDWYSCSPT
jgi:hypothetical protein